MPVSTLDAVTALVVIDLQKGIVSNKLLRPAEEVIQRSMQLANAFRHRQLPVIIVNVNGGAPGRVEPRVQAARAADWTELVPGLYQPGDYRITKQTWGAFTNTDLLEILRERNVTQIVLAGIATSMGVESTARAAHELGFNVVFALDAMTGMNADMEQNSVGRVFPLIGETGNTADILALLAAR